MAEANKSDDCECPSKWTYLQFALEKREDGKSLLEKFRGQTNAHQSIANQVLIQNF